jgi:HD-like signal output (HDOD) protein
METHTATEQIDERLFELLQRDMASNRLLLPSLPEVALRVRELSESTDCGMAQLAEAVALDPTISARLLKVANSAGIHGTGTIGTVSAAVTRLGMNRVRALVTQLCILQLLGSGRDPDRTRAFVESGLRVGAICHALAAYHRNLNPEEAMLAGLVHDIGKLPLYKYTEALPELAEHEGLRQQIVLRMHPRVGAILLESWNLPAELVQAAAEHEDLARDPAPAPDYADLVIAANIEYYGYEAGRYAGIELHAIPAWRKAWPTDLGAARADVAERLVLAEEAFTA